LKISEVIESCEKQIELTGENANVGFLMPGKWGKRDTRRLFPGGPKGKIVQEMMKNGRTYIYVMFKAKEVLKVMQNKIQEFGEQS